MRWCLSRYTMRPFLRLNQIHASQSYFVKCLADFRASLKFAECLVDSLFNKRHLSTFGTRARNRCNLFAEDESKVLRLAFMLCGRRAGRQLDLQRVPIAKQLFHLFKIPAGFGHILGKIVWRQQDDVYHRVVPKRVVDGVAIGSGPEMHSRLRDELLHVVIHDHVGVQDDTISQVAGRKW